MPRLNPFSPRNTGIKRQYLGKIILFCEGTTEYNYFDFFAQIINSNREKYSHIIIEPINTQGNARRVLKYADNFLDQNNNSSIYNTFEKYLIFDCDEPKDIQIVINEMCNSTHAYKLLMSNLLFETWLLMHFEIVDKPLTKMRTYRRLINALRVDKYKSKEKVSKGLIRKAIDNGENVKNAIENAKQLEEKYLLSNYDIRNDIHKMNPYTKVHDLVEKILLEI